MTAPLGRPKDILNLVPEAPTLPLLVAIMMRKKSSCQREVDDSKARNEVDARVVAIHQI